ncbi:MAG TPA: 3-phosphoshikimate 1-carboxyvinyltransferase [Bacteroidetes bacterium]|nr:3-phosphoshikimate 1-carboxyvinyltransferase [Bacteroidota bacterium]
MNRTISGSNGLRGTIIVPGDKSVSHRAVMIGALGEGVSEVRKFLTAADPKSTLECLSALGIEYDVRDDVVRVHGRGLHGLRRTDRALDAGNSGTTMRLMTGILAGQTFPSILTGDESLSRRPMRRVIEPLSRMGAVIESSERFTAPLRIMGHFPLKAIEYEMPLPSAQVKSALLFAGLYAEGTTRIIEHVATRDHTERMLGLKTSDAPVGHVVEVEGGMKIEPRQLVVPGDISSAAFLLAAGLIVPNSEITLTNIGLNPTRSKILDVLRSIGGRIEILDQRTVAGEPLGDLRVRSSDLEGSIDLSGAKVAESIDEIPVLAIVGAFTKGTFTLRDAADLRHKESDRIRAMVDNLRKIGIDVEEREDGFAFEGKKDLLAAEIDSFLDHRIAMSFGVAGLALKGEMVIRNAECVDISYPGFWEGLEQLQHS